MLEKWIVKHYNVRTDKVTIFCPHCDEWFNISSNVYEIRCYRHCPWCGKPLTYDETDFPKEVFK